MKLVFKLLAVFLILLFALQSTLRPTMAYYTNMPADVVVGQSGFTGSSANQGGSTTSRTINGPDGVSVGTQLFVPDTLNNRVLIYNQVPTSNNSSADVVVGQADFTSGSANQGGSAAANTFSFPAGATLADTRLIVPDFTNDRVLIYNTIPTTNNASADVVIGQPDMTTTSAGTSAIGIDGPLSSTYDPLTGKLAIADRNNHRILIYNQIPTTNGTAADVVIGQIDFTSGSANQGGSPTASTINFPSGVSFISGKLIIADRNNHRVLIYNSIPTTNNASADVVIGQADFTSNSANQGGSVSGNTLNRPYMATYDGRRLFIPDASNNRLLIYNGIPTTNNAAADVVLGQPDFTSNSANQGGSAAANTLDFPIDASFVGNKLFVPDNTNNRILIYNDIIATPGLQIDVSFESLPDKRLRVRGNIILGERDRYSMQRVQADVNGQGLSEVTSLSGGRDDGDETRYDFHHDFEPWAGISTRDAWSEGDGYTLKLIASSFNADSSSLFYFLPFSLDSATQTGSSAPVFSFFVNKDQIQRIKDNISHFEIWVKKTSDDTQQMSVDGEWTKYIGNISTNKISSEGKVTTSNSNSLSKGNYMVKVKSISKNSHWEQDSNTISASFEGTTFNNPLNLPISTTWFPLQINSITGANTGIISTTNVGGIQTNYTATTTKPTIKGIAFANSDVTLTVTDQNTKQTRVYTTKANPDSTFQISPTLYPNSTIDTYVLDPAQRFNILPSFGLSVQ